MAKRLLQGLNLGAGLAVKWYAFVFLRLVSFFFIDCIIRIRVIDEPCAGKSFPLDLDISQLF